jgi:hypothetical protein
MSSTNRGSNRAVLDAYYTPESTIHNFLDEYGLEMNDFNVLEPSAGSGAFCKVLRERYPNIHIHANEIRSEMSNILSNYADVVTNEDFLSLQPLHKYDLIIGNPPFLLALESIKKCFEISKCNTTIIMLLRTAFLETKSRYEFWKEHPLNGLYTLANRPSFGGTGTDSCSYSFFVWDHSNKQEIKTIWGR